jgi:hypothetical protein
MGNRGRGSGQRLPSSNLQQGGVAKQGGGRPPPRSIICTLLRLTYN